MSDQADQPISLSGEDAQFVRQRVAASKYKSPAAVVHEELRLLHRQEQAEKGELLPGEQVFDDIRRRRA